MRDGSAIGGAVRSSIVEVPGARDGFRAEEAHGVREPFVGRIGFLQEVRPALLNVGSTGGGGIVRVGCSARGFSACAGDIDQSGGLGANLLIRVLVDGSVTCLRLRQSRPSSSCYSYKGGLLPAFRRCSRHMASVPARHSSSELIARISSGEKPEWCGPSSGKARTSARREKLAGFKEPHDLNACVEVTVHLVVREGFRFAQLGIPNEGRPFDLKHLGSIELFDRHVEHVVPCRQRARQLAELEIPRLWTAPSCER